MGYEYHITRKSHWFDEDGPRIELDEWLSYVKSDPEMRLDGLAEASTPDGSIIRIDDPGIAVWLGFPGHLKEGNMAWFSHFTDRVSVNNAPTEIRRKMHRIAQQLGAKVQGDDGEEYGSNGEPVSETGDEAGRSRDMPAPKPWWKFW